MKLEKNPIILVANKADMVRNRKVKSSLGKELATTNNIKYIETSSGKFCAIITFSILQGVSVKVPFSPSMSQGLNLIKYC